MGEPRNPDKFVPKIGDVVRPEYPKLDDFVDRNDCTVEWVCRDVNLVMIAGLFATSISIDGKNTLRPHHGFLTDYDWGRGWTKVGP